MEGEATHVVEVGGGTQVVPLLAGEGVDDLLLGALLALGQALFTQLDSNTQKVTKQRGRRKNRAP